MLTPEKLRKALDARGLATLVEAAKALLNVSHTTVSRWLSGRHPIPAWVEVVLAGIPAKGTTRARSRASNPTEPAT